MQTKINVCLLFVMVCTLFSCGEYSEQEPEVIHEKEIVYVPETRYITETKLEPRGFWPDFSIVTGIYQTGKEAHQSLEVNKFRISKWSSEALLNPDFPMSRQPEVFHVVVISLREIGFLKNDLVSLREVLEKINQIGLLPLTPEQAVSTREQFIAQPDYTTRERLGEFFVAMEPMNLFADGELKIFSIHRDDEFPHPDTNVGLWLISNNINDGDRPRFFNPQDQKNDLGGRFACIVPPELNLGILEPEVNDQE